MIYYLSQKTVYYPKLYQFSKICDMITLSEIKLKGETMDNEFDEKEILINDFPAEAQEETTPQMLHQLADDLPDDQIEFAISDLNALLAI